MVYSLVKVADALAGAGRFTEARDYLTRAETMHDRMSTEPSVYSIQIERVLGYMAMTEGDFGTAETHYRKAISLAEELLNRPDHRYTVWAKRDYGVFLTKAGRTAEATEILEWSLQAQITNLGEPHPMIDRTRAALEAARGS